MRNGFLLHWFLFGGVDDEGFRDPVLQTQVHRDGTGHVSL